jgi:hypothetical protein
MLAARRAELLQFQSLGVRLLVLRAAIVLALALGALKRDNLARHFLLLLADCAFRFHNGRR